VPPSTNGIQAPVFRSRVVLFLRPAANHEVPRNGLGCGACVSALWAQHVLKQGVCCLTLTRALCLKSLRGRQSASPQNHPEIEVDRGCHQVFRVVVTDQLVKALSPFMPEGTARDCWPLICPCHRGSRIRHPMVDLLREGNARRAYALRLRMPRGEEDPLSDRCAASARGDLQMPKHQPGKGESPGFAVLLDTQLDQPGTPCVVPKEVMKGWVNLEFEEAPVGPSMLSNQLAGYPCAGRERAEPGWPGECPGSVNQSTRCREKTRFALNTTPTQPLLINHADMRYVPGRSWRFAASNCRGARRQVEGRET